ncbi:solute carrier organic anion transporter family member 2B1 [Protopterus annectens]|uniref:solute carrier organic anion transporter family member 2B1 n=1 Tax=Protopterus annectens TaxID=7888 RepID=UPI001CFA32F4|nr:solute carrier organic anion transporter family member 2B1 [Protopterus annectens]
MTVTNPLKAHQNDEARRKWRNPFLSIKFFVICHGFLQLSQLLVSGYLKSSISTIERRFGLSSQTSGMLSSTNEIGNTALIVFVSFFGSRVHRPRIIGIGAILVSIAGLLMALPHFIMGKYTYDESIANVSDICQYSGENDDFHCNKNKGNGDMRVLSIMFIGQFLLGIGGVPIQPFGISYIDDFASETNSPMYLGIMFAITVLGPGMAFMLGSVMLNFYVDIDKINPDEIRLTSKDPRWVGAWWLGFLMAASLVAIASIPYFFFPKEMPKEVAKKSEGNTKVKKNLMREIRCKSDTMSNMTLLEFIKSFPFILFRTLKNPIYLLVVLAQVNLSAMIAGLAVFMAKFLERQFTVTASHANLMIGGGNIGLAMVGIVVGGIIMKKLRLTLKQSAAMCTVGLLLCVCLASPLLLMGCSTQKVAGVNYKYHNSSNIDINSTCHNHCNCIKGAFNPICGSDGVEYISPCYAGCSELVVNQLEKKVSNYVNCSCIVSDNSKPDAQPGTCGSGCSHLLYPFVGLSALAGFVASLSQTPSFMLILRTVQPEDKSFAIGIQHMLFRVLAWMPGPVLYGSTIDTTCIHWGMKCGKRTECKYYDNNLFRSRFLGLQLLFDVGALLCFLTAYVIIKRQMSRRNKYDVAEEDKTENISEKGALVVSPSPVQCHLESNV